uniref:Uncharacterized protein n=1 Tax=Arundo donax TaxID=35708 RepID=A0A0A8ZLG4_ARUDO
MLEEDELYFCTSISCRYSNKLPEPIAS